jgi:hypothetical protein
MCKEQKGAGQPRTSGKYTNSKVEQVGKPMRVPDDRPDVAAVVEALLRHGPELTEALLDALDDLNVVDDLDERIWGPPPDPADVLTTTVRSFARHEAARARARSTALTAGEVAVQLGCEAERVAQLIASGELLILDNEDEVLVPDWQLHSATSDGLLPGIAAVAAAFDGGVLMLGQWVHRPNPGLRGRTPVRALAGGDVDAVQVAARARI